MDVPAYFIENAESALQHTEGKVKSTTSELLSLEREIGELGRRKEVVESLRSDALRDVRELTAFIAANKSE